VNYKKQKIAADWLISDTGAREKRLMASLLFAVYYLLTMIGPALNSTLHRAYAITTPR
jgi:hypothetical protein